MYMDIEEFAQTLIGMSEDGAKGVSSIEDYEVRVVARDGKDIVVSAEFNPRRINVGLEDGYVSEILSIG